LQDTVRVIATTPSCLLFSPFFFPFSVFPKFMLRVTALPCLFDGSSDTVTPTQAVARFRTCLPPPSFPLFPLPLFQPPGPGALFLFLHVASNIEDWLQTPSLNEPSLSLFFFFFFPFFPLLVLPPLSLVINRTAAFFTGVPPLRSVSYFCIII